jgi:hypothetical protein
MNAVELNLFFEPGCAAAIKLFLQVYGGLDPVHTASLNSLINNILCSVG